MVDTKKRKIGKVNKNKPLLVKNVKQFKGVTDNSKYFVGKHLIILISSIVFFLLVILIVLINKRMNVSLVNGQPISRIELYRELEKREGGSVLEELITKKLIFQEAKKRGMNISRETVSEELAKIESSIVNQGSTLEEILEYQNVTYEQLLENIKIQKILEQVLKDDIEVTESEIKERYEKNKSFYGSNSDYDTVKEDIRIQIFQEKISVSYKSWIDQVRTESNIKITL